MQDTLWNIHYAPILFLGSNSWSHLSKIWDTNIQWLLTKAPRHRSSDKQESFLAEFSNFPAAPSMLLPWLRRVASRRVLKGKIRGGAQSHENKTGKREKRVADEKRILSSENVTVSSVVLPSRSYRRYYIRRLCRETAKRFENAYGSRRPRVYTAGSLLLFPFRLQSESWMAIGSTTG